MTVSDMKSDEQIAYKMTSAELRKLQMTQCELIAEIDRICKKCGIKFNMVGGTMLGAVRHQGYIPWDDDADIGFLREEYEKFREACKIELNHDKFYIQDLRDGTGYRWGYGKLRRKGSLFVRLNQEFMPYGQEISIDLMPFDNVPDGYMARRWHFLKCFLYRKFLWSEVGRHSESNPLIRLLYKCMSAVPLQAIVKSYSGFIRECSKKKTKQVRILTFPTPKGVFGYDRKWYEELTVYEFEYLELPGAKDYDGYLKVKYGDYMKLPPENKRKVHPISMLQFSKDGE